MAQPGTPQADNPGLGIVFIIIGMFVISVHDMLIKFLGGDYALHQIMFIRSCIGLTLCFGIVMLDGGFAILRTDKPFLHALRGILIAIANMAFFLSFAMMPLADATALFFVAPLFITLLSIPLLGEKVGIRRIGAVCVGFAGVLVMLRPGGVMGEVGFVAALPIVAALAYALTQILTRKLGIDTRASALAVYVQAMFLLVSIGIGVVTGHGRFAEGVSNPSLQFLLRAWVWPESDDMLLILVLGFSSAVIAYSLSQAYRSASAATIAPFEYVALPMAIFWGWLVWGEFPGSSTWLGILLIAGSGIYVFARERAKKRMIAAKRPTRRW